MACTCGLSRRMLSSDTNRPVNWTPCPTLAPSGMVVSNQKGAALCHTKCPIAIRAQTPLILPHGMLRSAAPHKGYRPLPPLGPPQSERRDRVSGVPPIKCYPWGRALPPAPTPRRIHTRHIHCLCSPGAAPVEALVSWRPGVSPETQPTTTTLACPRGGRGPGSALHTPAWHWAPG